jgi:uncharacterized protein YijF (DUF1287 family)
MLVSRIVVSRKDNCMNCFRFLAIALLIGTCTTHILGAENKKNNEISKLIMGAKDQLDKTLVYNPAYKKIPYPNGDIPLKEGVCTDVIIRAFRSLNIDLQRLIHEDMIKNKSKYPNSWGVSKIDSNIDHRRVPNLMAFFKSIAKVVNESEASPGDIVVWDLTAKHGFLSLSRRIFHRGKQVLHIGILSDKMNTNNPLVIHNICCGVQEENFLHSYKIIKVYRFTPEILQKLRSR